MIKKHLATILAATVLAGGFVGLSAGTAQAYPRVNKCGSGYNFKQSWNITDNHMAGLVGFIDIYYHSGNGHNCAIARGNDATVTGQHLIGVAIRRSGDSNWIQDGPGQNYTSYAGPVYVYAMGSCIDFAGELSYNEFTGNGLEVYSSKHCG
ncbi:hypothetical protein ACWDRR_36860 [Kitasatospora sp. NPDC003701]